mmetsp:Transcript_9769/g.36742  ORF Transcript_9769/g.36742 Transcript_9769/m.36742 type:complete len:206 (+) Transcript_9769:510-1127(+)
MHGFAVLFDPAGAALCPRNRAVEVHHAFHLGDGWGGPAHGGAGSIHVTAGNFHQRPHAVHGVEVHGHGKILYFLGPRRHVDTKQRAGLSAGGGITGRCGWSKERLGDRLATLWRVAAAFEHLSGHLAAVASVCARIEASLLTDDAGHDLLGRLLRPVAKVRVGPEVRQPDRTGDGIPRRTSSELLQNLRTARSGLWEDDLRRRAS